MPPASPPPFTLDRAFSDPLDVDVVIVDVATGGMMKNCEIPIPLFTIVQCCVVVVVGSLEELGLFYLLFTDLLEDIIGDLIKG